MRSILKGLGDAVVGLLVAAPVLIFVASLWAIESRIGGLDFKPLPILNKRHSPEVDPLFQKYVDRFYAEAREREIEAEPVSMYFSVLQPGLYGMAFYKGVLTDQELTICDRYVLINIKYWVRLNETQRVVLVAHELGHAALGLAHEEYGGRDIIMMQGLLDILGILGIDLNEDKDWIEGMFDRMFARDTWSAKWLPELTIPVDNIETCTVTDTDTEEEDN